jgi:branched-chain amino acid transport system ATP-binding protein
MLTIEHLSVSYGGLRALQDVNLVVGRGELVALIGSNGAGKTTLLRTISGLLKPDTGTIRFADRRIDGLRPHQVVRLGVAHVPEGRRVFARLPVWQNLALGAHDVSREEARRTLERVGELFPVLKARERQLAGTMSGGEQQMLAIARAMMSRPALMMLDEPSLGLAPAVVSRLLHLIDDLRREGLTILLVEQKIGEVLRLADRGYVVQNGRIMLEASGREMLESRLIRQAYLGVG